MKKQIAAVRSMFAICNGGVELTVLSGNYAREDADNLISDGNAVIERLEEIEELLQELKAFMEWNPVVTDLQVYKDLVRVLEVTE